AVKQDDKSAQFSLGNCYRMGLGVRQDNRKALDSYILAANQEHSPSQLWVGYICETGLGVVMD
ncbi:hypothetical protein K457DRAFT_43889, partial [Linnemannia elongata AG-77]